MLRDRAAGKHADHAAEAVADDGKQRLPAPAQPFEFDRLTPAGDAPPAKKETEEVSHA